MASNPDTGGIITGWFIKLCIVSMVIGAVAVDLISYGVARFATSDTAFEAAREAAEGVDTKSQVSVAAVESAYAVASQITAVKGGTVRTDDFTVFPDGRVRLTVERQPYALGFARIPAVAEYMLVSATVEVAKPDN